LTFSLLAERIKWVMKRTLLVIGAAVVALALTSPAQAAYCGSNDVLTVHAGRNTSCELALNAARKAISYRNAYGVWPMHIHAYSSVKHRWYGFHTVAYFSDYLKWRGRGRDSAISFSISGEDLI
jgi:hypothetical protein